MISCWPGCSVNSQKTFWGPTLKPQGGLFLFVCFWFHHYAAAELKAKKWTVEQNKVWPLPLPCQRQDLVPGARLAQPSACMQPQGTFSRRRKGLKKHPASKPAQKSLLKVSFFLWNPVVVYATISEEHHPTHSDPPCLLLSITLRWRGTGGSQQKNPVPAPELTQTYMYVLWLNSQQCTLFPYTRYKIIKAPTHYWLMLMTSRLLWV